MATCRSCDAPIVWTETEPKEGKPSRRMPIDANDDGTPAVPGNGNLVVVGNNHGTPVVRYVPNGKGLHVSHFATCEHAAEHRKGKR